jgi:hypothetical protein
MSNNPSSFEVPEERVHITCCKVLMNRHAFNCYYLLELEPCRASHDCFNTRANTRLPAAQTAFPALPSMFLHRSAKLLSGPKNPKNPGALLIA